MSYCIDPKMIERLRENQRNALDRHCRIGRVKPKAYAPNATSRISDMPVRPRRETFFIEPYWPQGPHGAIRGCDYA